MIPGDSQKPWLMFDHGEFGAFLLLFFSSMWLLHVFCLSFASLLQMTHTECVGEEGNKYCLCKARCFPECGSTCCSSVAPWSQLMSLTSQTSTMLQQSRAATLHCAPMICLRRSYTSLKASHWPIKHNQTKICWGFLAIGRRWEHASPWWRTSQILGTTPTSSHCVRPKPKVVANVSAKNQQVVRQNFDNCFWTSLHQERGRVSHKHNRIGWPPMQAKPNSWREIAADLKRAQLNFCLISSTIFSADAKRKWLSPHVSWLFWRQYFSLAVRPLLQTEEAFWPTATPWDKWQAESSPCLASEAREVHPNFGQKSEAAGWC